MHLPHSVLGTRYSVFHICGRIHPLSPFRICTWTHIFWAGEKRENVCFWMQPSCQSMEPCSFFFLWLFTHFNFSEGIWCGNCRYFIVQFKKVDVHSRFNFWTRIKNENKKKCACDLQLAACDRGKRCMHHQFHGIF